MEMKKFILEIDSVLGFIEAFYADYRTRAEAVRKDAAVTELLAKREQARQAKDFAESDALRDELLRRGIVVNDTAAGQAVRLKEAV